MLRQGTPFYAGYELQAAAAAGRDRRRASRASAPVRRPRSSPHAKKGRTLVRPSTRQRSPGPWAQPRDRVVRALDYLEEQGWAELRATECASATAACAPATDAAALARRAGARAFQRARAAGDRPRGAGAGRWSPRDGCQVNALVGYFGEQRAARRAATAPLPDAAGRSGCPRPHPPPALPAGLDVRALRALCAEHPAALGEPRQLARFLCGLTSPALTRARLSRHPLFGALEERGSPRCSPGRARASRASAAERLAHRQCRYFSAARLI